MATMDEFHRRDLVKLYDGYNDMALLDVPEEGLTEVAREVLREEVARRGLTSAFEEQQHAKDVSPLPAAVEVWSGATLGEAAIILHMMEFASIAATLTPVQGRGPLHRLQITVSLENAERATELVAEGTSPEHAQQIVAEFEASRVIAPVCRVCGHDSVSLESLSEGNCWSCEHCGERWEETPTAGDRLTGDLLPILSEEEEVDDERKELRLRRANQRTIILVAVVTCAVVVFNLQADWTPLRWVGLGLWIFGLMLWSVARWQLGPSFTAKAEARRLVTTGLYTRLQNPVYLFGGLSLAGLVLYLDKAWLLLFLLILVPVQISRSRKERKVLLETFGETYQRYLERTWF